jgi:gas vesicle protein
VNDNGRYGGAHLLVAFVAGAAAGAAVALLTTPKTGRESREQMRAWAADLGDKASRAAGAVQTAYGRAVEAGKDAFAQAKGNRRDTTEGA